MQTKKFEANIKTKLEPTSSDWILKIPRLFPNIRVKNILHHTSFYPEGKIYKKLVRCDVVLSDEMIMMTIAQDQSRLEFFYFGFAPDNSSHDCLHSLSVEYLRNLQIKLDQETTENR